MAENNEVSEYKFDVWGVITFTVHTAGGLEAARTAAASLESADVMVHPRGQVDGEGTFSMGTVAPRGRPYLVDVDDANGPEDGGFPEILDLLSEALGEADDALGGDSNDAEHGALYGIRETIAGILGIDTPAPSPDGGLGEDEEEDADPRPDVDGFVVLDGGAYHVSLARRPFGQYRRREFAVYELARAMAETGYFPPAWISGEHGPATESIDEEVHAHLIEGPDPALRPLPGVRFEPGDLVRVDNDSWPSWVVDGDYGHLGVMLHTEGDESVTILTRTELVRPRTENEE